MVESVEGLRGGGLPRYEKKKKKKKLHGFITTESRLNFLAAGF